MSLEFSSGEIVGNSATAQVDAPETSPQPETQSNPWQDIIDGVDYVPKPDPDEKAAELEELLTADDEPDEKIPGDEETDDETADPTEKKSRSQKYKDLQETAVKSETLLAERDTEISTLKERLGVLDETLASVGSAENVAELVINSNKFIDSTKYAEAVDYINTLPHSSVINAEILNRSFDVNNVTLTDQQKQIAYANRVEVVNGALAKDFGLSGKISPEEMTDLFKWAALYANKDRSEWLADMRDEIELLAPDEGDKAQKETQRQIDELKAQLEAKNAPPEEKEEPFDPEKVMQIINDYHDQTVEEVAAEVLKDYNTSLDKLPPMTARALKALVFVDTSGSKNFLNLTEYLVKDKNHVNAKYLSGQYKNQVKTLFRTAAAEMLGKPAQSPAPKPTPPTKLTPQPKDSIQPPKGAEKENPWAKYSR